MGDFDLGRVWEKVGSGWMMKFEVDFALVWRIYWGLCQFLGNVEIMSWKYHN